MYCNKCGSEIPDNSKYCLQCGAPIVLCDDKSSIQNSHSNKKTTDQSVAFKLSSLNKFFIILVFLAISVVPFLPVSKGRVIDYNSYRGRNDFELDDTVSNENFFVAAKSMTKYERYIDYDNIYGSGMTLTEIETNMNLFEVLAKGCAILWIAIPIAFALILILYLANTYQTARRDWTFLRLTIFGFLLMIVNSLVFVFSIHSYSKYIFQFAEVKFEANVDWLCAICLLVELILLIVAFSVNSTAKKLIKSGS